MDEESIFAAALGKNSPNERATFLDGACQGDAGLRASVEELLEASDRAGGFLESSPVRDFWPAADVPVLSEGAGTIIGHYKLLEQIGEGGFGVVFLAEQERPVRRRVALKIIKPGMDTRQVIARFEAERQALAMMDHPNIAKVLDAGTTDSPPLPLGEGRGEGALLPAPRSPLPASSGRPYFVMELVQGIPITEYCDQCNLTTRERLELFVTVCQAVQHAHQKGIIHRDIKPTNVLVAIQDGKPAPKIIDFGVAKAINQQLTERTLTTAFAQMIGSPLYMSPEQAELSPLGVDTRSDIYSLGVLLYELLTGATPFDKDRLHAASYDELRRIIREEEPPRPSARLSSLPLGGRVGEGVSDRETAALVTTIAERRRTDPRRLVQAVRGELDWIVMKCLEKDRNRRYETPSSLARDVESYLHDEPVQACPPSASYRFHKFARRNKSLLAAGSAIAGALLIGLVLSAWMYFRAATEQARSKAVSDFLQVVLASVSSDADEVKVALRRGINVYDEPDGAAFDLHPQDVNQKLDEEFEGQPTAEAELAASYAWLANLLATVDRQDEAKAVVRKAANHLAHAAQRGLPPAVHLYSIWYLAIAQLRLGDETGYREACTAMRHVPIDNDDNLLQTLSVWSLGPQPDVDLSVQLKQAEELAANHAANKYVGSSSAPWIDLGVLGGLLYRAGQYEQAAQLLAESVAAYPDDALRDFRTVLDRQLLLAMTKWQLGQRDEARRLLAETQPAIDEWFKVPSKNTWMRRAEIEVLRREAEALIDPQKADEAVENKSRTSDNAEHPQP